MRSMVWNFAHTSDTVGHVDHENIIVFLFGDSGDKVIHD